MTCCEICYLMSIAKYAIHSPVKLRPQHRLAPPHPPSAQRGFHGSSDVPPVSAPHHGSRIEAGDTGFSGGGAAGRLDQPGARPGRSEERRGGKECVSTWRTRGVREHTKKNK